MVPSDKISHTFYVTTSATLRDDGETYALGVDKCFSSLAAANRRAAFINDSKYDKNNKAEAYVEVSDQEMGSLTFALSVSAEDGRQRYLQVTRVTALAMEGDVVTERDLKRSFVPRFFGKLKEFMDPRGIISAADDDLPNRVWVLSVNDAGITNNTKAGDNGIPQTTGKVVEIPRTKKEAKERERQLWKTMFKKEMGDYSSIEQDRGFPRVIFTSQKKFNESRVPMATVRIERLLVEGTNGGLQGLVVGEAKNSFDHEGSDDETASTRNPDSAKKLVDKITSKRHDIAVRIPTPTEDS